MLKRPRVLLLDEATSNLDPATEEAVRLALLDLVHEGTTIVAIVHREELMKAASHLVVMETGTAVAAGTYNELSKDSNGALARVLKAKRNE